MQPARPLRDVLTDLVGDDAAAGPAEVLAAGGHADLPDELMAEAVGSFADTAPVEVAEHLSAYVIANSPVPLTDAPPVDPGGWLDAVTTAPTIGYDVHAGADPAGLLDPTAHLDDPGPATVDEDGDHDTVDHDTVDHDTVDHDTVDHDTMDHDTVDDLGFGQGHHITTSPVSDASPASTVDFFDDPTGSSDGSDPDEGMYDHAGLDPARLDVLDALDAGHDPDDDTDDDPDDAIDG